MGQAARRPRDEGAAAAEFAVVMPAIIFVLLVLLAAAAFGLTQVRATDAARAGAREAARGEPAADVRTHARTRAGENADVTIDQHGNTTTVTVEIGFSPPLSLVLREPVRASATARTEGG